MTASSTPVNCVLVEDHAGTRAELTRSIAEFPRRVALLASFADGESLLRSPVVSRAEVALVDLRLPRMSGVDLVLRLATVAPHLRAVALTSFEDEATVLDALSAGAYGYLVKDEPIERIVLAVEEARAGEHPVSARVVGFLVAHARTARQPVTLTFREEELAASLAEGLSYAECAARMGIGIGTVQTHVKSLYRKLDVSSRAEVRDWLRRLPSPK